VSWGNTFPSCLRLFLRTFQQPNPFCCNRSTTNLFMISFLSRTIDLWIYLWLAETSQQPISQTTWLKVTPNCNHCNHCNHYGFICGWPRPVSSRSAKQPGWRSPPIVTIVTTMFQIEADMHYELHEDVLGFMWITLCANWQGFKNDEIVSSAWPCTHTCGHPQL